MGAEIEATEEICHGDVLYVSKGEDFVGDTEPVASSSGHNAFAIPPPTPPNKQMKRVTSPPVKQVFSPPSLPSNEPTNVLDLIDDSIWQAIDEAELNFGGESRQPVPAEDELLRCLKVRTANQGPKVLTCFISEILWLS